MGMLAATLGKAMPTAHRPYYGGYGGYRPIYRPIYRPYVIRDSSGSSSDRRYGYGGYYG